MIDKQTIALTVNRAVDMEVCHATTSKTIPDINFVAGYARDIIALFGELENEATPPVKARKLDWQ